MPADLIKSDRWRPFIRPFAAGLAMGAAAGYVSATAYVHIRASTRDRHFNANEQGGPDHLIVPVPLA